MEGDYNYPDIDRVLASEEFRDMNDRVVLQYLIILPVSHRRIRSQPASIHECRTRNEPMWRKNLFQVLHQGVEDKVGIGCDPNAMDYKNILKDYILSLGYDVEDYAARTQSTLM